MNNPAKKTIKMLSLLLIGLLSGAVSRHVAAQGGSTPIRITSQADPSAMDLEPNINWTKGNITGYNETEIIASRLDIVNNTANSNQQFYLDLSFEHARNGVLGILRLETTGVPSNAPITTNVSTTNPFLSDRDRLDNDLDGKIDNPGEPPVSQSTLLNQVKSRFHPTSFFDRTLDDLAGATTNGLAGSATRTCYLVNRTGSGATPVPVQVAVSGPFVSDKDGISKIPTNFGSAPALDDQNPAALVGYYRVAFTLAQPNDRFVLQFGARISQHASQFPGASLSWGIAGSTQNVPIPVNRILVPDLELTKSVSPATSSTSPALPGDTLTYSLRVRNLVTGQQGGGDAIDTYIVDALPAGVTFDAGSNGVADPSDITIVNAGTPPVVISGVTLSGNALRINLGNIDADGDGSVDDIKTLSDFTISFRVTINSSISACEQLTNTAQIFLTNTDANPANNSSSVTSYVCPPPDPDLTITKQCPPDPVTSGTTVTYTLNFSNIGSGAAQNVTIVDTLPAGVTFVSASDGGTANGQTVSFPAIATLAAGASGTRTITTTVTAKSGALTNSATISTTTAEPNTANNTSTCTNNVIIADVSITKHCPPDPVTAGTNIIYTLDYSNGGSAGAQGVQIVDTLPDGVTFVSATGGGLFNAANRTVTFSIGSLAAGGSGSVTITVHVDATGATLTNKADISTTTAESDATNNHSECTNNVNSADVSVAKSVIEIKVKYSVVVRNGGTAAANDVTLTDTLPAGMVFVAADSTPGITQNGQVLTYNAGTLAASGGQQVVAIVATVAIPSTGLLDLTALQNSASATTSSVESNTGNNSDSVTVRVQIAKP